MSMETFIQPKITGYRQLTEAEVALMNEGKALSELCGAFVEKLRIHPDAKRMGTSNSDINPLLAPLDQHWIDIGATGIQTGFMAVIRGIAQPATF